MGSGVDLMAQVGGGIEQKPMPVVTTNGDGRLGARQGFARTGQPAALSVTIPLRKPAAGGGTQDHDPKHKRSDGNSASGALRRPDQITRAETETTLKIVFERRAD